MGEVYGGYGDEKKLIGKTVWKERSWNVKLRIERSTGQKTNLLFFPKNDKIC